jgi:hypothetical protein
MLRPLWHGQSSRTQEPFGAEQTPAMNLRKIAKYSIRSAAKKKGHRKRCAIAPLPNVPVLQFPAFDARPLPAKALAVVDDGDGFVDVMTRFMKMIQNTRLQTLRVRIVLFLAAISDGLVNQIP